MKKQTAGRDALGEFAPKFAELNDDVLFGEIWSREERLPLKTRSIVTISVMMGKGIVDSSMKYHLISAKNNGVSKEEMAEIITHAAFYAGWPNAWAVFNLAKEVYANDSDSEKHGGLFGMGKPNIEFSRYFVGKSYLKRLNDPKNCNVTLANVTFEPGCRNFWHIHRASKGGGQILLCVEGEGWYQEEGKPALSLKEGSVVTIPANVKHWHGAKKNSWFSHIAVEVPGDGTKTEWLEPVEESQYDLLEVKR